MGKFRLKEVRTFCGREGDAGAFTGVCVEGPVAGRYNKSAPPNRKGIRLIFLNQDADSRGAAGRQKPRSSLAPFFPGPQGCRGGRGMLLRQRNRIRRRQREPWEEFSFLFNAAEFPGIRLSGDRVQCSAKHSTSGCVRCALDGP